ncbi:hypothetical protein ACQCU1_12560 [Sutcliffiella horikoshii]|uniref:hypothetical protein n=1 Tax=Sutcliffiella horikoshii TaxID=79883 RepID=UPI003CF734EC
MFLDTNLKHGQSVEIRNFRYYVAGRTAAEIEILCFSDGTFAGQGIIIINTDDERFATKRVYESLDDVLKAVYEIVELKIKDNEWVKTTIKIIERNEK